MRWQATAEARRLKSAGPQQDRGKSMQNSLRGLGLAAISGAGLAVMMANAPAQAWDRGDVDTFAVLPEGATGPEGIAVSASGDVYVATFGFSTTGPVAGPGKVYVYNDDGRLLRTLSIAGSTAQLLGLDFRPTDHVLLVIDFGAGNVKSVNP